MENPKTKKYEKKEYIQSTSVANSLKNLSDANVNNTKLALRFLGLPETIKDTQEINLDSNNTLSANVNLQKTLEDQEFMEEELKFMKKLIDQQ